MSDCITVVGLADNPDPGLTKEAMEAVKQHKVFAGGERHRKLVAHILPEYGRWITIKPPIRKVLAAFREEPGPILVFTSGDPLFYGFGTTLQKAFPGARYIFYPSFHSLQMLAHRCKLPYQAMRCASLTGRGWDELDIALIEGSEMIGVLTDKLKTPSHVAARMLEFGFSGYSLIVGEALGGPEERVAEYPLEEVEGKKFHELNCVILRTSMPHVKHFGILDGCFKGLQGRPNMITKMPVRLATLAQLDLVNARSFWDIGFCTGSISIEAKLRFPRLQVTAFEKRSECASLLESNSRKYRVPGIRKTMGDFLSQDHSEYTDSKGRVDAVFIGGHGGQLEKMFACIGPFLSNGGRIGINAVQRESLDEFHDLAGNFGYELFDDIVIAVEKHNPITVAVAYKH